jgi:hypothetical protein
MILPLTIVVKTSRQRKADLGFTGASRTILMDCTTASPLAKEIKEYKPGRVADALQSEKSTFNIRIDATLHFRC